MARKTFISYKYSEACDLRDEIIQALGEDAMYYNGETSDSPDLTDLATDGIKSKLKDRLHSTSVTIVIVSPKIKESKWIDWEIEYSLKEIQRADRVSRMNGIVAVVKKINGSYDWFINRGTNVHGDRIVTYQTSLLYPILSNNMFNSNPAKICCTDCNTYDWDKGSYISFIEEEEFLQDPNKYIELAYDKSKIPKAYDIRKIR